MKLEVTLKLIKDIELFEKVLQGTSARKTASVIGISDSALRRNFKNLYETVLLKTKYPTKIKMVINELDKFDLFTMKINRAYWLYQLKFLKQELGIK